MCAPVAQEDDLGQLDDFPPLPPVASDRASEGLQRGHGAWNVINSE